MDFSQNYFQVFDLPVTYDIDLDLLKNRYRELQKHCHPDKFVGQSSQQTRLSEQYSIFINQAFMTLLSPLHRAEYVLSLKGVDCNFDNVTHQDGVFLMEQMALQEALADIKNSDNAIQKLDEINAVIGDRYDDLQEQFSTQIDEQLYQPARETLAKMHFFQKLHQQAEQLEEDMDIY